MHPQNRRRPKLGGLKQIRPWNNSYKINSKGTGQKQSRNNQIWGYPKAENCKKVLKPNLNKETEVPKSTKQKWINKLGCGIILTKLIPKKMAAPKN